MLEDVLPTWPPELARELSDYGGMLNEYRANVRAARERGELEE
jgi:hypothetical protein